MAAFVYSMTDTWNNGGTTFAAIKMNVTNTASAADSKLLDLQVGSSTKFNVAPSGSTTITGGTVTISTPLLDLSQTWNAGAVTFTALKLHVTNTASALGSILLDLQRDGGSQFWVEATGLVRTPGSIDAGFGIGAINSGNTFLAGTAGVLVGTSGVLGFTDGNWYATCDIKLARDAANALAQRNGTNAQTFRVYNTYTDSINYERGGLEWNANSLYVVTQNAGTGSSRHLALQPSNALYLGSGGGLQWFIDAGNIKAVSDKTYEIGADGGSRPNNIFTNRISTQIASTLTIATGAVTATGTYHVIDTQAAAATDDLDTINGGVDGALLIIRPADSARTVVAKDGTGNLQLAGDHSMDNAQDTLTLIYVGALTAWLEIARSNNGA